MRSSNMINTISISEKMLDCLYRPPQRCQCGNSKAENENSPEAAT